MTRRPQPTTPRGGKPKPASDIRHPTSGFTLLEVLLAVSVLAVMSVMIFGSFEALIDSTLVAEETLDRLHQGDVIMDRLVRSLRSAAYFDSQPSLYEFRHEKGAGDPPEDMASWVTHSMAFLPPTYPTREGLNRIFLGIEEIDGRRGLAVSAVPHMQSMDEDAIESVDPWLISARVKGFGLRYYDLTENDWVDEWERDNQLPISVEVTLVLESEEDGEPTTLVRRVDIPVGKVSRDTRRGRRLANPGNEAAPGETAPPADTSGPEPGQRLMELAP